MPNAVTIAQNTPVWVFALLVLLIFLGVQALRPRIIPVRRLLIVPGVFIVWGLVTLAQRSVGSPVLLLAWLAFCAAGMSIGWRITQLDGVAFDRGRGLVQVPGSTFPLVRNLVIFAAKYGLAAAMAIAPAARGDLLFWDVGVSGLTTGYFLAWLIRFALKYRRTEDIRAVASQ
jgi:hypothetical protein